MIYISERKSYRRLPERMRPFLVVEGKWLVVVFEIGRSLCMVL